MHVGNMDKGMVPGIAIVGGGIPLAAGMALSFKMQKQRRASSPASSATAPSPRGRSTRASTSPPSGTCRSIFVCENNLYGASTRVDHVMRNARIADRAAAYGIRGETVDGNDVLAVYEAARSAAAECRAGQGPVLLELLTYRRTGHSRRDACHYQPKDEREEWLGRDPIERFGSAPASSAGWPTRRSSTQVRSRDPGRSSRPPSRRPDASRCRRSTT